MLVTINTDASWCPKEKVGGYAFWISSPWGKFKKYGKFKSKIHDCTKAEMMCIANAIYYLSKKPFYREVKRIIINTDSLYSINYINSQKRNVKRWNKARGKIKHLTNLNNIELELRHVKAHTEDLSKPRVYVNDWCDRMSKKGRKL